MEKIDQGNLERKQIYSRASLQQIIQNWITSSKEWKAEATTHDRSKQPDKHTVAIQDDPEVYHDAKTLNTDNETIRERIEEDMDFKIPGLPHSIVKQLQSANVRELIFRRSRTTRIDMLFNKTYDRINHLIPSVQNQNK